MYIAASSHCFCDLSFREACEKITDLEYDKIELYMDEGGEHLKPSELAADPEKFVTDFREMTRLTPIGIDLATEPDEQTLVGLSRLGKLLKITQISIPASPLGTPFNMEIDRLRNCVLVTSREAIRTSIKTVKGTLAEDPHTAVELCQSVKGLGITLDPSHLLGETQQSAGMSQVYEYVFHVHFRDSTPTDLQVPVGMGQVDYAKIISLLEKQEYERVLSVDFLPDVMEGTDRMLEMRKLRMLLDSLL